MKKGLFIVAIAVMGVLLFSCKMEPGRSLRNTTWQITSLAGVEANTLEEMANKPTISFSDSSTISGFSGCNSYFGNFNTEGNQITINILGSTLMMCPESDVESAFYSTIPDVGIYEIVADTLLKLYDKNGEITNQFKKIKMPTNTQK